jgi:hypothetical protein
MTDTKIIYIQDDHTIDVGVQFCYSEHMSMIDRWAASLLGEDPDAFHCGWERDHPEIAWGVRNLDTSELKLNDFIGMCNTLGYVVKRVKNEVLRGDDFKTSCLEAYPEDFK